jgi:hypothetical protein
MSALLFLLLAAVARAVLTRLLYCYLWVPLGLQRGSSSARGCQGSPGRSGRATAA